MYEKQFDSEKPLETPMHKDHNHSGVNLNVILNSYNELDIRLEQLEVDKCDDGKGSFPKKNLL